jgi:hypothetical protein
MPFRGLSTKKKVFVGRSSWTVSKMVKAVCARRLIPPSSSFLGVVIPKEFRILVAGCGSNSTPKLIVRLNLDGSIVVSLGAVF